MSRKLQDSAVSGTQAWNIRASEPDHGRASCGLTSQPSGFNETAVIRRARTSGYKSVNPLRSVAFRIGLAFWLLFMGCFATTGAFLYESLQAGFLARTDADIEERLTAIGAILRTDGIDALLRITQATERLPTPGGTAYHLARDDRWVAGSVPRLPGISGWSVLRGSELGVPDDQGSYRFMGTTLEGYDIAIVRSIRPLEELRAVTLRCLLGAFVVSTLLAIVAAAWIARRMRRRLDTLSTAIDRVGAGDLCARIPLSRRRDNVDAMAQTINAALERLSRSVEGMRQVSTDIAHDLKTPLNRLWILIDEAAAKSRRGVCVGDELDVALEEARGIDATFEALLGIAQIEAGARRSRFAPFDLSALLETIFEIYEPVVEEACQTLTFDKPTCGPLELLGDRELVTQLVVNLVENALRHGGASTGIVLACGQENGRAWLQVTDHGPGVPESERTRVLQRLYRLETSRTTPGSGLGLSLVKAIVDLHQGELVLEDNAPGLLTPGLSVTVRFGAKNPDRQR